MKAGRPWPAYPPGKPRDARASVLTDDPRGAPSGVHLSWGAHQAPRVSQGSGQVRRAHYREGHRTAVLGGFGRASTELVGPEAGESCVARIDRYILKEAIWPFLFGLAAFTSLLIVNVLFVGIDYLNQGLAPAVVAKWMALNLPEIVVMTLPMATLLGTLLTFGRLSSNSEVTAMWASGLSLTRIMRPLVIASLLVSLGAVALNDRVVAPSKREAERVVLGSPAETLSNVTRDNFYYPVYEAGKARSIWIASRFDGKAGMLSDVYLFDFGGQGLSKVTYGRQALWKGNVWVFEDGYIQQLGASYSVQGYFPRLTVVNNPPPKEMAAPDNPRPDKMTLSELRQHIKILRHRGADVKLLTVEYHLKMAIPFACLVFALVGAPFGLQPHRGGSSVGLGLSIVLIFGFYVLLVVSKSLGQSGVLAPAFAAWLPDMVFGAIGIYLVVRKSR